MGGWSKSSRGPGVLISVSGNLDSAFHSADKAEKRSPSSSVVPNRFNVY